MQSLVLVIFRNKFYKKIYYTTITAITLAILLVVLVNQFKQYQDKHKDQIIYFPTTDDGMPINMPSTDINHLKLDSMLVDGNGYLLEQPTINLSELDLTDKDNALILYWSKKVIRLMFDYDYLNYRKGLQEIRNYFAPGGHKLYMKALKESKNLETVKAGKRIVYAKIIDNPKVVRLATISDHYAWQVRVPIKVYYENIKNDPLVQNVIADMWIMRVSTLQSPFFGLSVIRINLETNNQV